MSVVFRHSDRYSFSNASRWPVNYGKLTADIKMDHLGFFNWICEVLNLTAHGRKAAAPFAAQKMPCPPVLHCLHV